ncbi:hypothetical protein OH492_11660 [Vibrio chagasii]|nr:hypothetical protein [Vibrio chagasii]
MNNYNGLMPESAAFLCRSCSQIARAALKLLDGEPGKEVLTNFEKFGLKVLVSQRTVTAT